MAKINLTPSYINRKHKREAGLLVVVVIFFFMAFAGLCPFSAEAKDYFMGKNSEVFAENSADFVNETILIDIADDLKKKGGMAKIELIITCTEIGAKRDNSTQLSDLRIAVLKKYFQNKLPGSQVEGFGQTVQQPNIKLSGSKLIGNIGPDFLKISGTVSNAATSGENTEGEPQSNHPLEPWRLKLLERYKKVEENHRTLCEQPFPMPSQECQNIFAEECGDRKYVGDIKCDLCFLKKQKCRVINNSHSIYDTNKEGHELKQGEYDLERIQKIKETAGEVFSIAKEIQAHTGDPISYDSRIIDDEIKSQELAIKHLRRGVQKAAIAIADLPTQPNSYNNTSKASHLYDIYSDWILYDEMSGTLFLYKTRKATIDHIKELHNYVRFDLHLPLLDSTGTKPLCVPTNLELRDVLTLEKNASFYNSSVKPRLIEYGIQDIPLE